MHWKFFIRSCLFPICCGFISFIMGYRLAITHSSTKNESTFLVILILSSPSNVRERQIIRSTWLSRIENRDIKPFFVIGIKDTSDTTQSSLELEHAVNKDIIRLSSITDSYSTLTEKVLEAMIWIEKRFDFRYLLKVDDDSYVQISELEDELRHSNYETNLYWGYFNGIAPIFRSGKWAEHDYNLCDRYLPYALGGGYVLSQNIVEYIVRNSRLFTLYNGEDVSVGTWISALKLHRIHDVRFDTEHVSRGCFNDYLILHKRSIDDIKRLYETFLRTGVLCEKEYSLHPSYVYNWKVPPSKCCMRVM